MRKQLPRPIDGVAARDAIVVKLAFAGMKGSSQTDAETTGMGDDGVGAADGAGRAVEAG